MNDESLWYINSFQVVFGHYTSLFFRTPHMTGQQRICSGNFGARERHRFSTSFDFKRLGPFCVRIETPLFLCEFIHTFVNFYVFCNDVKLKESVCVANQTLGCYDDEDYLITDEFNIKIREIDILYNKDCIIDICIIVLLIKVWSSIFRFSLWII